MSSLREYFPGRPRWSVEEIPDLVGKVAIVTGANVGIGYETAKALLKRNAKVYLACRSRERGQEAVEKLIEELRLVDAGRISFLQLDLFDLAQVKQATDTFKELEMNLHLLFLSAGVSGGNPTIRSTEGFEIHFATNVLGHFAFLEGMMPCLKSAARDSEPGTVRVCFTSSISHIDGTPEGFDSVDPDRTRIVADDKGEDTAKSRYGNSKCCNILLANKFGRLYPDIVFGSCNPGIISTSIWRHAKGFHYFLIWYVFRPLFFHPPERGALPQLYFCTMPGAQSGQYVVPWTRIGDPLPITKSHEAQDALYDFCAAVTSKITTRTSIVR